MVHNTKDPQWREMTKRRQGPLEYRLFSEHGVWYLLATDGGRVVESRLLPPAYVPTVKGLLSTLQNLYKQRIKDMTPYQLGLCAYLSQVRLNLRYELPLKMPALPSSWRSKSLNAYLHREYWGFLHDDDGRAKYEQMCEQKSIAAYVGEPWEEGGVANGINFPEPAIPALSAPSETTQPNQAPSIQQQAGIPLSPVTTNAEEGGGTSFAVGFGSASAGRMEIDDENGLGPCDDGTNDFGAPASAGDIDEAPGEGLAAILENGSGRTIGEAAGLGDGISRSTLSSINARSLATAGRKGSPPVGNLPHRAEVARKKKSESIDPAEKQRAKRSKKRRGPKKNKRKSGAAAPDPRTACAQGPSLLTQSPSGKAPAALQGPRPIVPGGPTTGIMQGPPSPAPRPASPRPARKQHPPLASRSSNPASGQGPPLPVLSPKNPSPVCGQGVPLPAPSSSNLRPADKQSPPGPLPASPSSNAKKVLARRSGTRPSPWTMGGRAAD